MAKRVVGLDIGSFSIKVVHVESHARTGELDVISFTERPLLPSPVPENPAASLLERQEAALVLLREEGHLQSGSMTATALSGLDAQMRVLTLPFADEKKIEAVIAGELDVQIPFDLDGLMLSWSSQGKPRVVNNGQEGGSTSVENDVLVAFARKDAITQQLDMLKRTGTDPRWLTPKASALSGLAHVLHRENAEGHVCVVDIGHVQTSICVVHKGQFMMGRTILRGGFDATREIASRTHIDFVEAERRKVTSGFIEVGEQKGKMLEEHLLSEAIKEAYAPIAKEVRQTIMSLRSREERSVSEIILVGGGALMANLQEYFTELLGIPVHVQQELNINSRQLGAQYGTAVSYAVSSIRDSKKRGTFNFRRDEFAWRGEFDDVRQRLPQIAVGSAIIFLLLVAFGVVRSFVLDKQLVAMQAKQSAICDQIVGSKTDSASRCLAIIQDQIAGRSALGIPQQSATDVLIELSRVIPSSIPVKVTELTISDSKVSMNGEVPGFENVDAVVEQLATGKCFRNIEKGRARQMQSGVGFQASFDIDCAPASAKPAAPAKKEKKG